MSSGIRSIDSTLIVAPAAFQADSKYETSNYIGTRVLQDVAINIDVINGHTYSFINDLNGVRRGTYPENKLSSFNSIKPLVRWRDANTPNKQLWITEWGWDADGAGEDCDATECVTEHAQAVYAFRGLMILSRSNVARATWYFYANSDCSTLFCRSGLTSSQTTHFQRKTVFGVLEEVLELVGNSYFFGVVQESYSGYVYALTNSKTQPVFPTDTQAVPGNTSHIVAWLPVDINDPKEQRIILQLSSGMHVQKGIRFTGQSVDHPTEVFHSYSQNGHMLTLTISRHPVIVEFSHAQNLPIVG
ncbi:hypothetical protein DPMN_094881 [Dreissena polymorpha]|uniref:Uncharacterized protein n=1 Tax=Dreissena polymorpha TaxID=45954 RepID=A0A9D4R3Y0_DREPO|nr:hypothetical protein DPMN_094881 [Dreissena polymorpha]